MIPLFSAVAIILWFQASKIRRRHLFTVEILSKYLVFVLRPVTHLHFSSHPPINCPLFLFSLFSSSGWSFLPLPCSSAYHLLDANLNLSMCVMRYSPSKRTREPVRNDCIVKTYRLWVCVCEWVCRWRNACLTNVLSRRVQCGESAGAPGTGVGEGVTRRDCLSHKVGIGRGAESKVPVARFSGSSGWYFIWGLPLGLGSKVWAKLLCHLVFPCSLSYASCCLCLFESSSPFKTPASALTSERSPR